VTFKELANHFRVVAAKVAVAPEVAAALTAPILLAEAKGILGTHVLRDLMQSTQDERASKGYAPNEPLVREGEYRDTIVGGAEGPVAFAGTNDPRGKWFEWGTVHAQPFSAFALARDAALPQALAIAAEVARDAMKGQ
jgi:hypothetical protein